MSSDIRVWVDGARVEPGTPAISAVDHGVTVGDGGKGVNVAVGVSVYSAAGTGDNGVSVGGTGVGVSGSAVCVGVQVGGHVGGVGWHDCAKSATQVTRAQASRAAPIKIRVRLLITVPPPPLPCTQIQAPGQPPATSQQCGPA